jgi:hypothetical protein
MAETVNNMVCKLKMTIEEERRLEVRLIID